MESINFAKGYKEYVINGDESNILRVNLADQNIQKRAREVYTAIEDYKNSIASNGAKGANLLRIYEDFDELIKEKIDYTFGKGTAKAVFGDMNCLAVANDDGACVFETFMDAIMPIIKRDITDASRKQKKHIDELVNAKKLDAVAAKIKGTAQ